MKNKITVNIQNNSQYKAIPAESDFTQWLNIALKNHAPGIVNIAIVDAKESQALNKQFRHKDKPTNVLSFPFEAFEGMVIEEHIIGDLVICADVIQQEADAQQKDPLAHWAHLSIHGSLHLVGFDHQNDAEANKMESLEIELLQQLGYPNPYE